MSSDPQPLEQPEGHAPTPVESPPESSPPVEKSVPESSAVEERVPFGRTAANESPIAGSEQEALPEWEELTPELMEDECVRGDFMIRWAVVLLAVLLGCVHVTETPVLVRIRTGEHLLSNGLLPPRTDLFSAAGADRPWVNLHWFTDLLLGGVHQALGMWALSLVCALTTAIAFRLLGSLAFPKMSNWWTSCCSALALLAVFPVLQPGDAAITVVAISVLCVLLFRLAQTPESRSVSVGLPILFLFWTNMDHRAWIGMLLLVGFSVGEFLRSRQRGEPVPASAWAGVGGALGLGILANPWPGAPLTAWLTMLREQQELREYRGVSEFFGRLNFTLIDPELWGQGQGAAVPDPFLYVAVCLFAISLLCLVLNFQRVHFGWLIVWLIGNGLAFAFGEMVCFAAIVNAAAASLNGLDWYRNHFSMEYSVRPWPVFQARAGRAVTVLALFAIAYTAINGMLMGPQGRRIGLGLDPRWRNRLADFEQSVLPGISTDTVFPTLPDVGDVCLWFGKRPFIDSRLGLHSGGAVSRAKQHREIRRSIFPDPSAKSEPAVATDWKASFGEFGLQDVALRLWGDNPAYSPLIQLLVSRDWQMTGLTGAGANFTRADLNDPGIQAHIEAHRADRFIRQAFRDGSESEREASTPVWPAAQSSYDRWMIQKLSVSPRAAALGQHYMQLHNLLLGRLSPQDVAALMTLAMRHARQGIVEDPNHPLPYRVLRSACFSLSQLEREVAALGGAEALQDLRMKQVLAAAYHAARAGGRDVDDLVALMQIQRMLQKFDLCRDTLLEILERPQGEAALLRAYGDDFDSRGLLDQLEIHVARVEEQLKQGRTGETPRESLAAAAAQAGCPGLAIRILDEDLTELAGNPTLQLLHASLAAETGRTQESWDEYESMEQFLPRGTVPRAMTPLMSRWRNDTADANLTAGDPDRAVRLWGADQATQLRSGVQGLLQQPFAGTISPMQLDLWSGMEARLAYSALIEVPEAWASLQLKRAFVEIEAGHLEAARKLLEELLATHPEVSRRSLVVFYLNMMSDTFHDPLPPSDWIPVEGIFAPDAAEDSEEVTPAPMPPTGRPTPPPLPERI